MVKSVTKVLTAQGEYWHAGHLAELLLEAADHLGRMLDEGFPGIKVTPSAFRRCKFPGCAMRIVRAFVKDTMARRPDLERPDPVLAEVNADFEALFAGCVGCRMDRVHRLVEGRLSECVAVFQSWIVAHRKQVEAVTRRPAFEWIELAATLAYPEVAISGLDGRHARVRRLLGMLDSVVAMGDMDRFEVVEAGELVETDASDFAGVGVPDDRYMMVCEMIERESEVVSSPRNAKETAGTRGAVISTSDAPDSGSRNTPARELRVDAASRLAFWGDKKLTINSNADFEVLNAVHAANRGLVTYTTLLRVVKPNVASANARQTTAPPEVREAVEHINKAFVAVGCGFHVVCARKHGYRLHSSDE